MPSWLTWRSADNAAQRLGLYAAAIAAIGAAYAAAVAAVSWVTNSIPSLAQYGWGVPVLAAIGVVLVIVMGLSFAAVPAAEAWRKYHPLPPASAITIGAPALSEITNPSPADIGRLERQIEVLKASLTPLASKTDLEQLSGDISRLNELGVSQHQINDDLRVKLERQAGAQEVILKDLRNLESKFRLFVNTVRAHDAMNEILKPNDRTAMSLGKKLMYPEGYLDARTWLADYQVWRTALRAIDDLVVAWTRAESTAYSSLFDLKERHYEQAPMPPENIRSDETIIAFKTACQVQSSYANQRDGIFSFFNERMFFPG